MAPRDSYDSSWDEDNQDLWDKKYAEWKRRDWETWLKKNLTFPFEVQREEDFSSNPFSPPSDQPFSLGHVMKVLAIEYEDEHYGILVKVREGKKTGGVPLCDVEVTSREDKNFWPVREYVVWFANRSS
ncbi:MAG TPA: calcium-binding protein [Candidatus Competibacteraceae bacterium]|nr:calcium-binding protein [Candidatus Competibacteraceae bacterium]